MAARDKVATTNFKPDVCFSQAEVSIGDKVWLLFWGESRTSEEGMRKLPSSKLEGITWPAHGSGLVLSFVSRGSGGESLFRRVSTFRYEGVCQVGSLEDFKISGGGLLDIGTKILRL